MVGISQLLRNRGIQPSAQRLAIAAYVLQTGEHPSADEVWLRVQTSLPMVSRATVYNTLNLFVDKGLLRQVVLREGRVLFDPKMERHHHLVDEVTGTIYDVAWESLDVRNVHALDGFAVSDYEVVLHGTKVGRPKKSRKS